LTPTDTTDAINTDNIQGSKRIPKTSARSRIMANSVFTFLGSTLFPNISPAMPHPVNHATPHPSTNSYRRAFLLALLVLTLIRTTPPVQAQALPEKRPIVVLVHGFWDTGEVFETMQKTLKKQNIETLAPTLEPRDGRKGLEDLATKLRDAIDKHVEKDRKIYLVGFSMGSLVSRQYLQRLGGKDRTLHFFSISGPHHGTKTAPLYPSKSTRQMEVGSTFLNDLNEDWKSGPPVPTTSFWTPADLMIIPPKSSVLPGAENKEIDCLLHPLMVRNKVVIRTIIDTIFPPTP
jgi:triacylglycerol lipase